MLELDARQIATLIWAVIIILGLILWSQTRRAMMPATRGVLRAMATWKVILPIVIYFCYAIIAIFVIYNARIWHNFPLIDALLITLFIGLPMLFNANNERSGEELFRKTLRETVGVSALVAFYIGLAPLSLVGELILQPSVGLLVLLSYVAGRDAENKPAKKLFDTIFAAIGLWLIIRTANVILTTWRAQNVNDTVDELIVASVLPLLLLPAVYVLALIMRYEIIFSVSKIFNNGKKMRWPIRLACFVVMNFQLGPLNNLGGIWLQKLNEARGFREAQGVLKNLKRAYSNQKFQEKARKKRLRKMKGKHGVDLDGLQLDRREFYESKHDLENLLYAQMGQFRNGRKHYNPDLPIQLGFSKLPAEHGITMKVRRDKKSWYAWRQMPNGYYFGVGGSPNADDMWFYDGAITPNSYPTNKDNKWRNKRTHDQSKEWRCNDTPPKLNIPEDYFE